MDPFVPSTQPIDPDVLQRAMRLSILPEQEQRIRERMAMAKALAGPHTRIRSGGLPAALWGAGDAIGDIVSAYQQRQGLNQLQNTAEEKLKLRQSMLGAAGTQNPADDPGVPQLLQRPEDQQDRPGDALRRRGVASAMAMTGDPAMEKASDSILKEQQLDREYAQMQMQMEQNKRQFGLEQEKFGETKRATGVKEQNEALAMHGYDVKPVPDLGGVLISNKLGDSWLHIPGQAPVAISKGVSAGGSGQPIQEGGPVVNGGGGAAGGALPFVKETEAEMQAKTRAAGGASGLQAALSYGFPSTSKLGGLREQGSWIAAQHGFPGAATDVDQLRAAAWNSVFDLEARERAGLRIPEELRSQMRQELRVTPGEPWTVQVAKTKQVLGIFRNAASSIKEPTARARVNAELDQVEQSLPQTKQDFDAFNKSAATRLQQVQHGAPMTSLQPQPGAQPQAQAQPPPQMSPGPHPMPTGQPMQLNGVPQPGPQPPPQAQKPSLQQRLQSYGWK